MPTPRVPSHLKKLRGTYVASQDPEKRRVANDGLPALVAAPRFLNGRQRTIWKVALGSAPPNLLKNIDRDVLASWVVNVDRQRVASRLLNETADLAERALCHKTITDTTRLLVALSDKLGFNPSARLKVRPEAPPAAKPADDPWAVLRLSPEPALAKAGGRSGEDRPH